LTKRQVGLAKLEAESGRMKINPLVMDTTDEVDLASEKMGIGTALMYFFDPDSGHRRGELAVHERP
jgi:hypothetical protein